MPRDSDKPSSFGRSTFTCWLRAAIKLVDSIGHYNPDFKSIFVGCRTARGIYSHFLQDLVCHFGPSAFPLMHSDGLGCFPCIFTGCLLWRVQHWLIFLQDRGTPRMTLILAFLEGGDNIL
jgi:hypothetical protein